MCFLVFIIISRQTNIHDPCLRSALFVCNGKFKVEVKFRCLTWVGSLFWRLYYLHPDKVRFVDYVLFLLVAKDALRNKPESCFYYSVGKQLRRAYQGCRPNFQGCAGFGLCPVQILQSLRFCHAKIVSCPMLIESVNLACSGWSACLFEISNPGFSFSMPIYLFPQSQFKIK